MFSILNARANTSTSTSAITSTVTITITRSSSVYVIIVPFAPLNFDYELYCVDGNFILLYKALVFLTNFFGVDSSVTAVIFSVIILLLSYASSINDFVDLNSSI